MNLFYVVCCVVFVGPPSFVASREYCQFETFNATCQQDEVVLITSASYGRLNLGRCVTRDYGYLGCAADVTDYLDATCAGKRKCLFHVPSLREVVQPCPKDLTAYLDAAYICVHEIRFGSGSCNVDFKMLQQNTAILQLDHFFTQQQQEAYKQQQQQQQEAYKQQQQQQQAYKHQRNNDPQFNRSRTNQMLDVQVKRNHDKLQCNVTIATGTGQTIRVTAFNFNHRQESKTTSVDRNGPCDGLEAMMMMMMTQRKDGARHRLKSFCSHLEHTGRSVEVIKAGNYSSILVALEMMMTSRTRITNRALFFEVVGCRDVTRLWNVHEERSGEEGVVVRCNSTRETWTLTCKNNTWIGAIKNCSDVPWTDELGWPSKPKFLPNGLLVAVIVGAVFGMVSGVLLLLCVYLCQRRRERNNVTSKSNTFTELACDKTNINDDVIKDQAPNNANPTTAATTRNRTIDDRSIGRSNLTKNTSKGLLDILGLKTFPRRRLWINRGRVNVSFPIPPPPPTLIEVDEPDASMQTKERWFSCNSAPFNSLKSNSLRNAPWKKDPKTEDVEGDCERNERTKSNVETFSDSCLLCQVNRCHTMTSDLMTIRDCQLCASHDGVGGVFFTQMSAEVFLNDGKPIPK